MAETVRILEGHGVATEVRVLSARRTPDEASRYAREAEGRGLKVRQQMVTDVRARDNALPDRLRKLLDKE